MSLPTFRYHPDPVATGSIEASPKPCVCCGQERGFIYVGSVYGEKELFDMLCPWCIHDGSAHTKLGAEFADPAGVGGYVPKVSLPRAVVEEVAFRTPGFTGWQGEQWLPCCGDVAAFVGRAGHRELESHWQDAIISIQEESRQHGADWERYFHAL